MLHIIDVYRYLAVVGFTVHYFNLFFVFDVNSGVWSGISFCSVFVSTALCLQYGRDEPEYRWEQQ